MDEKQTRTNRKENKMDNKDIIVTDVTENVETTTEEMGGTVATEPKTYTQEEVDKIVGNRLARNTAKIRKEYDRKYGNLENVLRAGTGKESVEEMTDTFADFYRKKGISIPTEPTYSARDIETLARAEASDIIQGGLEDVIDEVDRLADIGVANMTPREKALFTELANYRKDAEESRDLAKLGVTEDVYTSKEFKEFASQFNSNTPITKVYEIFNKMQPKKETRTMGSMKNTASTDNGVKDFYTRDEALQYSKADFDKNPKLYEAIVKSMQKW
jgi:hypothetical protein